MNHGIIALGIALCLLSPGCRNGAGGSKPTAPVEQETAPETSSVEDAAPEETAPAPIPEEEPPEETEAEAEGDAETDAADPEPVKEKADVEPEKKPAARTWVTVQPTQCMNSPWQKDYLKSGGQLADYDSDNETKVVKAYYAKHGIEVYKVKKKPLDGGTCAGCSCPTSWKLSLEVDSANGGKIGPKGQVKGEGGESPPGEPGKKQIH